MSLLIKSNYLSLHSYQKSLILMEEKTFEVVQQKKCYLIGQEHPLVYTSGLKSDSSYIRSKIEVIPTRRGGAITLHNPGQLVVYTILPFDGVPSLKKYIRFLEKVIISLLNKYNISSYRDERYTGVWTTKGKIAFIGLGLKRGAIYHGISINVFNDLTPYEAIFSCGLNLPVTNMVQMGFSSAPFLEEIFNDFSTLFREGFDKMDLV